MYPAEEESSEGNGQRPQQRVDPEQLDRDELVCMIRQRFSDAQIRDRDAAIRALAKELGYERAGGRIRETLDNALRTAVRRGVLANDGDALSIDLRSIERDDASTEQALDLEFPDPRPSHTA